MVIVREPGNIQRNEGGERAESGPALKALQGPDKDSGESMECGEQESRMI